MRRVKYKLLSKEHDLNWNIKLMELSIKLQSKSHTMVKEALKLYREGIITKKETIDIIRISGIRLSRIENPRKFKPYDDEFIHEENNEEIVDEHEEVLNENYEVISEEYLGESIIRKVYDGV